MLPLSLWVGLSYVGNNIVNCNIVIRYRATVFAKHLESVFPGRSAANGMKITYPKTGYRYGSMLNDPLVDDLNFSIFCVLEDRQPNIIICGSRQEKSLSRRTSISLINSNRF